MPQSRVVFSSFMETLGDINERKKCDSCFSTIRDARELLAADRALGPSRSFRASAEARDALKWLVNETETILRLLELGSGEQVGSIMTWERTLRYMDTIEKLTSTCITGEDATSGALYVVVGLAKSVAFHFISYTYSTVGLEFDIVLDIYPGFLDDWLRQTPKPYLQLWAQTNEIVKLANSVHARKLATKNEGWERCRSAVAGCVVDFESFVAEILDHPDSPELVRMQKFYDIQVPSFVFILAYGRHMQSKDDDLSAEDASESCCWVC